jgi:hypothetical protein
LSDREQVERDEDRELQAHQYSENPRREIDVAIAKDRDDRNRDPRACLPRHRDAGCGKHERGEVAERGRHPDRERDVA